MNSRLLLIDPAQWPTNQFGILARYDDAADGFRLVPPHDWPSDVVPFDTIQSKGKGKGKGTTSAPLPDLLPKGERNVKEPTPEELDNFFCLADVLT